MGWNLLNSEQFCVFIKRHEPGGCADVACKKRGGGACKRRDVCFTFDRVTEEDAVEYMNAACRISACCLGRWGAVEVGYEKRLVEFIECAGILL